MINSINSRRMQFIRDTNNLRRLNNYLHRAIRSNILLFAFSFFIMILGNFLFNYGFIHRIVSLVYIFTFLYSLLLSVRFVFIFVGLLVDPEKRD
jgi:hypothetical protein